MKFKKFWHLTNNAPIFGFELVDINGNGKIEIIAYTKKGELLFISLTGKLLNKEIISKNASLLHLKIWDINDDGRYELIIGGTDGLVRIYKCNVSYKLELLWIHKCNSSISGILFDDINEDNLKELIIFSLDKTLRILNPFTGELIWGQVFEDGIGDAQIFINKKNYNKKEIIACGNDGTIRCFDGKEGKLLWVRKYYDKMRVITYMNKPQDSLILCGGDDKKLHIINNSNQNEIKTIEFEDYVWKCITYPFPVLNKVLVSSYSFIYFNNLIPIQELEFTSTLMNINNSLHIRWKLKGYNIEFISIIENLNKLYILAGTTKGELLFIEEQTGKIIFNRNYHSCVNMARLLRNNNLLFSCHDNGKIFAYKLEDHSLL